jgi:hypothetical protein
MNPVTIAKYVFSAAGFVMLAIALFWATSTRSFVARASTAQGTVIELVESRSNNSSVYYPRVSFSTARGERVAFRASVGSNPPQYTKGETVEVLYLPERPYDAKINGALSLWFGPALVGSMGAVFFLIGAGIFIYTVRTRRLDDFLMRNGTPVETKFQMVERHTGYEVNGRYPFRVVTQWQNPATSQIHIFHSHDVQFDPSEYVKDRSIRVFIDRADPKRYYVDLSFLPKLAR